MELINDYLLQVLVTSSALMLLAWIYSLKVKEVDVVDFTWSLSLGVAGVLSFFYADGLILRKIIVTVLVLIWSLRLSFYLLTDRVLHKGEDPRYIALRDYLGSKALVFFFLFFQFQALLVVFLASTYFFAASNSNPIGTSDYLAIVLFFFSIFGESLSDYQLKKFKKNLANKGKTCKIGLWRYSRHPNYFFEWLKWVSFPLLAFNSTYFIYSFAGPVLMYILLRYVSGVPYTEKQSLKSRKESYKIYQKETSVFFPWFIREIKN
jgi:steroid 5-alpha reductase family enzyme